MYVVLFKSCISLQLIYTDIPLIGFLLAHICFFQNLLRALGGLTPLQNLQLTIN